MCCRRGRASCALAFVFRLARAPSPRRCGVVLAAVVLAAVVLSLEFEELGDEDAPPESKLDGDALCSFFFSSVCLYVHFFRLDLNSSAPRRDPRPPTIPHTAPRKGSRVVPRVAPRVVPCVVRVVVGPGHRARSPVTTRRIGRKGRQSQAAWARGRSRSFPVRCFSYPPWRFLVNRS